MQCKRCGCDVRVPYKASHTLCRDCRLNYWKQRYQDKRKPSEEKAYTIIEVDPDSDWSVGATFSYDNFTYTLRVGYFPNGTKFKHGRKTVTVWECGGKFFAR